MTDKINTLFIFENDSAYDRVMTFDEMKKDFELVAKMVMANRFGTEPLNSGELMEHSSVHQYDTFYELETTLSIEQVKEVIEHDFYVDWMGLCKVIGKIRAIK